MTDNQIRAALRQAAARRRRADDEHRQAIATIAKLVRESKTISVTELAQLAGTTRQTIYNLRRKK